jgi:hypothetical protein
MSASTSRRDNTDRSLARSAWEAFLERTVPQVRYDRMWQKARVFLKELNLFLGRSGPMMFHQLLSSNAPS